MDDPQDPLAAPFLAPVTPDAPAGEDLSYSEEYQRVRAEMDKVGSVSSEVDHEAVVSGEGAGVSGGGVDFEAVVDVAGQLLRERTKDVQLASYLTYALMRARGLAGLTEGLVVTRGLAATFWEGLHPQKPVRRRNAMQFLADRAKDWVSTQKFGADDAEALATARGAVVALQALTTEQMGEGAPGLGGLRQTLDDAHTLAARAAAKAAVPPPEPAPEAGATPEPTPTDPAPTPSAPTPAPAAPRPATPAPAASAGADGVRSAGDARQAVLRAAAFLRERDAASPAPYRLTRAFSWGGLVASPPNQAGKTLIPPADAATRTAIAGASGDPRTRLNRAEDAFVAAPLWLDPQRAAAEAAAEAGLLPIRDGIHDDVRGLLRRCPDLPTLTFNDGTPLADEATRAWLVEVGGAPAAGPATVSVAAVSVAAVPAGAAPGDDAVAAAVALAEAAVAAGDFAGAVAVLQQGETEDRTARDRFRRRLHLASLCLRGEQPAVARLLLDPLAAEVDRHALDAWEPALAVEVWAQLYAACTASASGPPTAEKQEIRERAALAFARMCRLDPARGLAAQPRR